MSKAGELAWLSALKTGAASTYDQIIRSATHAAHRGENELKAQLNIDEGELDRVIYLLKEAGFGVTRGPLKDPGALTITWGI